MTRNTAYKLAYASTVAAAAMAATLVAGTARAEGPFLAEASMPFTSTLSRAEVQAEVIRNADAIRAGATEYAMQQDRPATVSTRTRSQVTAEYIAAREQVHALTSEDSGSAYLALGADRMPTARMLAQSDLR